MSGVKDRSAALVSVSGSRRDRRWWLDVFIDPVIQRIGVPVMFLPREEHSGRRCVTLPGYNGDMARVVMAPVQDGDRYPGEACLWNVTPGALLFGESWIASGDLLVIDDLLGVYQRGGAHR